MGLIAPKEWLLMRWTELGVDPRWHDLASKFELNGLGVIELSPANNKHARRQAKLAHQLQLALADGEALVECSVWTTDGIRVPDVAWASADFMARHGDTTPYPSAPEICVEVRSPANTDAEMAHKTMLYLEAGAIEVWIVDENGERRIHDGDGERTASRWPVTL